MSAPRSKKPSNLITISLSKSVNSLLRAVAVIDPSKLVIILDNVDKYEHSTVNAAFLRHASLFQSLDCHLTFTIQSSLLDNPVGDGVEESFGIFAMPMLPVFLRHTRNPDPAVLAKLRQAVYLRVPQSLFAGGDAAADQIILASGDCWRDLLRLPEAALFSADDRSRPIRTSRPRPNRWPRRHRHLGAYCDRRTPGHFYHPHRSR